MTQEYYQRLCVIQKIIFQYLHQVIIILFSAIINKFVINLFIIFYVDKYYLCDGAWSRPLYRPKRDRKPKSNEDIYYY